MSSAFQKICKKLHFYPILSDDKKRETFWLLLNYHKLSIFIYNQPGEKFRVQII